VSTASRELVLASAGSGKTFRISSRIIGLLARGTAPASLLASTFTRKAAGEILGRVLIRLAEGAENPEAAADLGGHAGVPDATPELWQSVLGRTMRSIHELDVATLDAFFARAVRSFGHDLGLPSGWTVADEAVAERIQSQALEAVLESADEGVMVELVRGIRGGDVSRSVHESLSREADEILGVHRDLDPEAPGWEALAPVVAKLERDLAVDDSWDLAEELGLAAAGLRAAPVPLTGKGTPHAGFARGVSSLAEALEAGELEAVVRSGLFVAAGPDGSGFYYGKEIDEGMVEILRGVGYMLAWHLARDYHARARASARLGDAYDAALREALYQGGVLRFDDVTSLLGGHARLAGRDDLGYRLDGGVDHLLLDEFQDTSLLQWRALQPMTDSLMAREDAERTSLSVVADPKQSIYGWRNAAPVIVEGLPTLYPALEKDRLDYSFRSSQTVLDTVNAVFREVADAPVLSEREIHAETARRWAANFHPHARSPHARPAEFPGYAVLRAGPTRVGTGQTQPEFMGWAAGYIRDLHRAAPDRSIGVLVRTTKALAQLILRLRELGVPASEEGGTRLVDAPAVVSVLALLRLADHPGNTLARYHVARTPVGRVVGLTDPLDEARAGRVAHQLRDRLLREGYGPTLAWLARELDGACDARDRLRLSQLTELAFEHDDRPSLRTSDFVRTAMKKRVESAGEGVVRVMTVWGSKGLEFDTVVLPQLFNGLVQGGRGKGPPLALRADLTGPVTHAFPYMSESIRELLAPHAPQIQTAWAQQAAGQVRDGLGGLYVAMTRARHALHMLVPADGERASQAKSEARLLRWALAPDSADQPAAEGDVLYQAGDPAWHRKIGDGAERDEGGEPGRDGEREPGTAAQDASRREGEDATAPALPRIALATRPHRTRMLPRRRPSDHGPSSDPGVTLAAPSPEPPPGAPARPARLESLLGLEGWDRTGVPAAVRGSVVHGWMEAVEWLEGGLPEPGVRHALARREAPELSAEALERFEAETWPWLQDRLARPGIQDALSLERAVRRWESVTPDPHLTVERELPFYLRLDDALVEGVIDRLVLVRAGRGDGPVLAAHILDYKTDAVGADDPGRLRERSEHYAPQLESYRVAVSRLYRVPVERVRATLLFLEPGVAVPVGAAAGEGSRGAPGGEPSKDG
jgi:ATP-dependent exoDNAse (exonuclease V) beta subunit